MSRRQARIRFSCSTAVSTCVSYFLHLSSYFLHLTSFIFLYIFQSLLFRPLESLNHLARVISSFGSSQLIVWLEWRFSAPPITPFFPHGSFFTSTANDWLLYEHRFMGFWTYVRRAMNICSFANGHRSYKLAPLFLQYVIDHFFFVVKWGFEPHCSLLVERLRIFRTLITRIKRISHQPSDIRPLNTPKVISITPILFRNTQWIIRTQFLLMEFL